jgi:DNA-binding response OmpR family regulator
MSGIAIYEEDEMMRALIEEWLSGAGYRVRVGAPLRAQVPDTTDLVIVSVYMPKHAGAQLIQELRAAYPRTPLIALSGQFRCGLSSAGAAAQSLGVAQIIAKPLTREALLGTVHAMIGPPT